MILWTWHAIHYVNSYATLTNNCVEIEYRHLKECESSKWSLTDLYDRIIRHVERLDENRPRMLGWCPICSLKPTEGIEEYLAYLKQLIEFARHNVRQKAIVGERR